MFHNFCAKPPFWTTSRTWCKRDRVLPLNTAYCVQRSADGQTLEAYNTQHNTTIRVQYYDTQYKSYCYATLDSFIFIIGQHYTTLWLLLFSALHMKGVQKNFFLKALEHIVYLRRKKTSSLKSCQYAHDLGKSPRRKANFRESFK